MSRCSVGRLCKCQKRNCASLTTGCSHDYHLTNRSLKNFQNSVYRIVRGYFPFFCHMDARAHTNTLIHTESLSDQAQQLEVDQTTSPQGERWPSSFAANWYRNFDRFGQKRSCSVAEKRRHYSRGLARWPSISPIKCHLRLSEVWAFRQDFWPFALLLKDCPCNTLAQSSHFPIKPLASWKWGIANHESTGRCSKSVSD